MRPSNRTRFVSRRDFLAVASTAALAGALPRPGRAADDSNPGVPPSSAPPHPLLTPAAEFRDVSRGNPKPWSLTGDALVQARLTPESWRLEIAPDDPPGPATTEPASLAKPLTLAGGTALDLPTLLDLTRERGVKFLKAMQCLNIPNPLGQGLWEGVPLREVLRLCGRMRNVRRVYYWGFHNRDPRQRFQSSLSYSQAMETPPGELPAFLACRLNGEPIPLMRGGPVRMIIPWAHGFKSIKWLQHIALTNDYHANDTYAEQNNDPESHLKTAAYLDDLPAQVPARQPLPIRGLVVSGWSGLQRVEYLLQRSDNGAASSAKPVWIEARLEGPPADWSQVLPPGVSSHDLLGFDPRTGAPATWPLRYTMVSWFATLAPLPPGRYALQARAVDGNGFAQPEPRPDQKSGQNAPQVKEFEAV